LTSFSGFLIRYNGKKLKEIGDVSPNDFAEKDISITTNLSLEHNAANFF
jgi:hypothetical protein